MKWQNTQSSILWNCTPTNINLILKYLYWFLVVEILPFHSIEIGSISIIIQSQRQFDLECNLHLSQIQINQISHKDSIWMRIKCNDWWSREWKDQRKSSNISTLFVYLWDDGNRYNWADLCSASHNICQVIVSILKVTSSLLSKLHLFKPIAFEVIVTN